MERPKGATERTHRITWGEMDALGHVNNATYFKYYEDVRIDYFKQLGFDTFKPSDPIGPVLAQISCQYRSPIVYPDTIRTYVWVEKIGNTSLQMDYSIFSEAQNAIVATGTSIVVMVNYATNEKVRVSDDIRERIKQMEE
jgi:acyl-CoA thioester hydrolase